MFRANLGKAFIAPERPRWVDQLLSPESLRATGYFDLKAVQLARAERKSRSPWRRCTASLWTWD